MRIHFFTAPFLCGKQEGAMGSIAAKAICASELDF